MKNPLFCLLTLLFFNSSLSQLQIKLPIWRIDSIGQTDTAYFGVDERATYCLDPELGEGEIWWQACGLVPCLAFVDVRYGSEACLGEGTMIDLRPYYSTTQIDTYKLKFDGYLPIVFHWDKDIPNSYESMLFMNNVDTNLATFKINMIEQDSLVLTSYGMNGWWIRTESPNPVTNIHFQNLNIPETTRLLQNYPNPFNPSTTIKFELAHEAIITLSVFNVLGREVRSLIKEQQFNHGVHKINFNANELSSGIYFYRILVRNSSNESDMYAEIRKMVICK